ncbi:WbqC family protein [Melaminivora jejuensis]|uniref:WbqC family protein n=1 Tax=Melaminivora jejuensis TaxID=1267217 RepID=UPI001E2EC8D4|nr:WbqC family protein [Melaminivora jejuensis]UHJ64627.1 WbqC family protein [Melaminivora jejuensis]
MLDLEFQKNNDAGRKTVVVSQPMYFPWVGQLEQVRLADKFIFYDDVQFARGFFNRVQIKVEKGSRWMTVPLQGRRSGQLINEIQIDDRADWRRSHMEIFRQAYRGARFLNDALGLMDEVFTKNAKNLAELSEFSVRALVDYFSVDSAGKFCRSSDLKISGSGSQRILDICRSLGAVNYLTGHGARGYLNHAGFESDDIDVFYAGYECLPYQQLHGGFNPYVSALDLVANCGVKGRDVISGYLIPWRDFIQNDQLGVSSK